MAEFINTIDVLGDDAVIDSIIDRTITEFKDDKLTSVGQYAFYMCTALETVDLPGVVTLNPYAFAQCANLVSARLPSLDGVITKNNINWFSNCTKLELVDLGCITEVGNNQVLYLCTNLKALILRLTSQVCTASSDCLVYTSNGIKAGKGYIYVPRALVEDYKVATNWSTYAAQFRALEDYTVDGTVTGELDETKI